MNIGKEFLTVLKTKAEADEKAIIEYKNSIQKIIDLATEEEVEESEEVEELPDEVEEEPTNEVVDKPVLLQLKEATDNSITIKWNDNGASKYYFYRNNEPGGWDKIDRSLGQVFEYKDEDLKPNTQYRYLIQSILEDGTKINSLVTFFSTTGDSTEEPEEETEESTEEPVDTGGEKNIDVTIKLDSSIDNTESLQAQLDSIPNGTEDSWAIVRFPKGSYNVEGKDTSRNKQYATRINLKKYWIVMAYDCELYVNKPAVDWGGNVNEGRYSHRRQLRLAHCQNVIVNGLKLRGAQKLSGKEYGVSNDTPDWWLGGPDTSASNTSGAYVSYMEFEHNFNLEDCYDVVLEDCVGVDPMGDSFYLHGGGNIVLKNCYAERVGRQLVATSAVNGFTIDGLIGIGGRRTGIDLETDYAEQIISNIEIKNCYIECNFGAFTAGGPGAVNNVHIHHNKFDAGKNSVYCRSNGLRVRRENWLYEYNERLNRYGGSDPVIKFGYTDNVIVRYNIDSFSGDHFTGNIYFQNMEVYNNSITDEGKNVRVADYKEGTLKFYDNVPELTILDNTELVPVENRKY